VRALREHPPALLVVCDAIADDEIATLAAIPGMLVLGGAAALRPGPGKVIACAHGRDELAGIVRALGAADVRIAIAPTPPWLWRWLGDAKLRACTTAGTVHARALSVEWARWADRGAEKSVLVPVGVATPALDRPGAAELDARVAAHALERWTGPVFPSPRVIAIVRGGLSAPYPLGDDGTPPAATLAVWMQARRALPLTGAIVGMERPAPALPLDAPTAAFLAQRALLRVAQCRALAEATPIEVAALADDGLARAREVLEGAPELLSDHESKVVLRGLGMHVTRQAIASSASGASGFAERLGFPVVLKALSPDLRRRTEIGAVALDLANAAAVRRAYASIVDNVERRAPTARLDGVVVAEMIEPGLELSAGAIELASGDAAVYARALGEHAPLEPALALVPAADDDTAAARALTLAHAVLSRLPVPALRRGSDPDVRALAELFVRLFLLWHRFGSRLRHVELERVRLVGGERGYVILDARVHQGAHLEGA
jgi:hypothetical protein